MRLVIGGSSMQNEGNIGNDRVTSTPIAVIAGCTIVIERGFVEFGR
jgi:hypothetical protein